MNQNFFEPNLCYEPNSSSFDQYQPMQSFVTQQFPQRSNEDIKLEMAKLIKNNQILLNDNIFPHKEASMEVLLAKERILKLIQAWDDKKIESWSLPALLLQLLNDSRTIDEMLKKHEQAVNLEYLENSLNAIATVLPTEELEYSLSMGDEHLSTIPETESDEVIKSSVKNLVQIPSEYEVTSDDEKLLSNDTPPIPENESSNFDHHHDSSFPRPPPKPPDVEIFFESDSGVLTTNVVKGISEHDVLMPNIFLTLPTFDLLYPVYDTLLPFLSENEDKVFKPGDIHLLDVPYLHFYPP
uniref:Reverse transcriptase domain-containing protein n=1 Tax=Tanacetum cinerariifolium TaxID=118510 RepID=A0A6L2K303_TANCI|nr:hypothetical protein [Tanacetum cinerariifolium]